ncbi:sel1 repeat family protein [Fibrisoma montanum]|uniref:Sel1 repeat family protein n=1 Tax=Fibrisoma montanum TaxID=2305895 RepID=A0A418LXB8_9BACT|nr:tetratricopeptide repeat protein [Fibrisoma montanum]RIV17871.1 sel1 repeat family protein [Fibrisoma montanum]
MNPYGKYILLVVFLTAGRECLADPSVVASAPQTWRRDSTVVPEKQRLVDEGLRFWDQKDYVKAEQCFRKAADKGYSWGQYNLALCYFHGRGAAKDLPKAAVLFQLAARQGNPEAQCCLATMYHFGMGMNTNYEQALRWYTLAAKAGNVQAHTYIGSMYQFGQGVERNYQTAYDWYQKAAGKDCANAMYYLGTLYEAGNGVEKNPKEALKWYRASADQNNAEACYRAFRIYYYELADAANGYNYLTRAAAQNHVGALYELGETHYLGLLGRPVDRKKARLHYTKAADAGNSMAQMALKVRTFDE